MLRRVKLDVRDKVAVISLAAAPGASPSAPDPGFDPALRQHLAHALADAAAMGSVGAVMVRAGAAGWPVADDPEAQQATADEVPRLAELATMIETSAKPVIVALDGRPGCAALALAFAAGWRLAAPGLVLALGDPDMACLPPPALLVRVARRVGATAALRLSAPGSSLNAAEALALGLIDGVVESGDVEAAALSVARALAAAEHPGPRLAQHGDGAGLADPAAYLAALSAARGAAQTMPTPLRKARAAAIAVIEAALLLPYDAALDFAEVARADLAISPECRALTHVAGAEARARIRALAGAQRVGPSARRHIGIWGFAADVPPLADALAAAGFTVVIGADTEAALASALAVVAQRQHAAEAAGHLPPLARQAAWARIEGAVGTAGFGGCDWVLSRAATAAALPPEIGLVLAGERSSAFPAAPDLRLVAPGLVELGSTPGDAIAGVGQRAVATLIAAGLVVLPATGPIGMTRRLAARAFAAAERAALAGARPDQIDAALEFADPPFRRADRLGLARVVSDLRALGREPGPLSLRLLAERLIGRSTAFYGAEERHSDPAAVDVNAILHALRSEAGLGAAPPDADFIRTRVLAELADEGAAMLQSGQASSAGDIDLAAVLGLGLPKSIGGPMHAADARGILTTRNLLRDLSGPGTPPTAALWDVLIRNGHNFADLDRS